MTAASDLPKPNEDQFRQTRAAADHLDEHLAAAIAENAPKPQVKSMSITGIGGAGSTIKQLLEDHKAQMTNLITGHVADLKDTLEKQKGAAAAFGRMVQSARSETDDFLADLGQYTNDLGL